MGDNADHNAGDDQGHPHKGNEHIGDHIHNGGDGAGEQGHIVGVGDLVLLIPSGVVGGNTVVARLLRVRVGGDQGPVFVPGVDGKAHIIGVDHPVFPQILLDLAVWVIQILLKGGQVVLLDAGI